MGPVRMYAPMTKSQQCQIDQCEHHERCQRGSLSQPFKRNGQRQDNYQCHDETVAKSGVAVRGCTRLKMPGKSPCRAMP